MGERKKSISYHFLRVELWVCVCRSAVCLTHPVCGLWVIESEDGGEINSDPGTSLMAPLFLPVIEWEAATRLSDNDTLSS